MMTLPVGTVTFLFTDIEGSTRLWEDHPEAMRVALARHEALLRAAIEAARGMVFKSMGDGVCAAFSTAPDALAASLNAQRALAGESWPDAVRLEVRMALHTGAAELRDSDYFGPPLNRVARLLASGHGGQVLLSEVTQELARDMLPGAAALVSLGEHRLRDLSRSENVYQLQHPELRASFPPLRSLDNPALPNNLPPSVTSFVGREKEIAEVTAMVQKFRLVTLSGSGGAGKSRLSLQVAADLLEHFPEGAWLVELAPLADPVMVLQAIAQTLNLREEPDVPLATTLSRSLRGRCLLLVLDNCEHVLTACATIASDLLRTCPQVHLLVSSREALGVAGEQTYRLPSLTLPDPAGPISAASLAPYESVRLFLERARAVQPSFTLTDASAEAVAQICWRLDGIPLAIDLAAARVRAMRVEQVLARLDDRFRLLTGGSRTALPRQQTLRALIDWSYDLLTEPEKVLLRRLSVFAGGWTLEAAESVCASDDGEAAELLDLLTGLVDKSLAVYEEREEGGGARYRLLETVRQYARDRLLESGEAQEVRGCHVDCFLALAEEAEPKLSGPEQEVWLDRLDMEHDNLRAALDWCPVSGAGRTGSGLRLAGALSEFWILRGLVREGIRRLDKALADAPQAGAMAAHADAVAPNESRAKALGAAGHLCLLHLNFDRALPLLEESLHLYQALGEPRGIASALGRWGLVLQDTRGLEESRAYLEQSLALYEALGDEGGISTLLFLLGGNSHRQGDWDTAQRLLEQSLALSRKRRGPFAIATSLGSLGNLAWERKEFETARLRYEECLGLQRRIGHKIGVSHSLMSLANLARVAGDYEDAVPLLTESIALFRESGDDAGLGWAFLGLGNVMCLLGHAARASALYTESLHAWQDPQDLEGFFRAPVAFILERMAALAASCPAGPVGAGRAARLLGAAQTLRDSTGLRMPLVDHADYYDALVHDVRAVLGDEGFASAWADGEAMTQEQVMAFTRQTMREIAQ